MFRLISALAAGNDVNHMITDAIKAITQLFSPPLRVVLGKSIGLALALIVVVGIVLERLIVHFVDVGGAPVESTPRTHSHLPLTLSPRPFSIPPTPPPL